MSIIGVLIIHSASQVNHQAEQLFSYEGCPYTSMFVTGEGNINRQMVYLGSKFTIRNKDYSLNIL